MCRRECHSEPIAHRSPPGYGYRTQRQHINRITPIERQLGDLTALDCCTDGACRRIQQHSGGLDENSLPRLAHFESEIEARNLIDFEPHQLAHRLFETRRFGRNAITARKESRDEIVPALIGHRRTGNARININSSHLRSGCNSGNIDQTLFQ